MLFGAVNGTGTRVGDTERRWRRECLDALRMEMAMENATRPEGNGWRKLQHSTHGPYLECSAQAPARRLPVRVNSTLHSGNLEAALQPAVQRARRQSSASRVLH